MKHGSLFFFFFSHTPCSLSLFGAGGCEDEPAARSGSGLLIFSAASGDRGGLPVPRRSEGGLAPGSGAGSPLGVVVPGPRSIECIWGVWVWVPCPFLCVYMWGEGVNIVCVHEGGDICLCICVLVIYVYVSGRALDSASLIILVDPTPPPCPAGGGCRRCVGDFSRRGRMLGQSAGPTLGGRLAGPGPTGPDCGVGGLWVSGPRGPVRPGMVGCRWSLRACRHGTLGAYTVASRRSRLRALLCPFLGGGRGCPCGWFSWGSRALGVSGCLGPGSFHACFMPCGMGLLFPTHTIKHLHGGTLWTQARSHTQVYTKAFTLV